MGPAEIPYEFESWLGFLAASCHVMNGTCDGIHCAIFDRKFHLSPRKSLQSLTRACGTGNPGVQKCKLADCHCNGGEARLDAGVQPISTRGGLDRECIVGGGVFCRVMLPLVLSHPSGASARCRRRRRRTLQAGTPSAGRMIFGISIGWTLPGLVGLNEGKDRVLRTLSRTWTRRLTPPSTRVPSMPECY